MRITKLCGISHHLHGFIQAFTSFQTATEMLVKSVHEVKRTFITNRSESHEN